MLVRSFRPGVLVHLIAALKVTVTGTLDAGLLLMAGISILGGLATILLVPARAVQVNRATTAPAPHR